MATLQDIPQFYQLTETLGTAGQPLPDQFSLIREQGYEMVINLSARPDAPNALPMERAAASEPELVQKTGMEYLFMPVDWFSPEQADLDKFFAVMKENRGRKLFVHCALNCRVSAFLFLYRVIVEDVPIPEAKAHVDPLWKAATGKLPEEHETWTRFVREAMTRYKPEALKAQSA